MAKKSIEEQLNKFIQEFDFHFLSQIFNDLNEIFELYDVTEDNDWVEKQISEKDDLKTIRLIRTAYLLSKLAENHAGRLCTIKSQYPKLYQRLEKYSAI